ncbi:MAG TPA: FtsK/SpoIIIE domain-containing protein, partial [Solirubrobacteraceae bacterium]|nr:FtsK/SpoIIIE domain-containing protein [Solirubrobacteraceae bacterium]
PLAAPEEPRAPAVQRFSVVSAFAPVLLGVVMVIALHNLIFALFVLLSPVMVIGTWYESRRQSGSILRGARREHDKALASFAEEVGERASGALAEQRQMRPDLAEIVRRATAPSSRLWERRPEHEDFLSLSAGLGERGFRPTLARGEPSQKAEEVLGSRRRLRLTPVPIELAGGGVVGIVGPRPAALALARGLLCQAAVLHGPADLQVAVLTEPERCPEWDWAKWLPHARGAGGRLLAGDAPAAQTLTAELRDAAEEDERRLLAVIDGEALIEGRGAVGRELLRSNERVSGIVIARQAERLPAVCTSVLELSEGTAEALLTRPQAGERVDPVLVAGASPQTARECALGLARFDDADLRVPGGSLPGEIALLPLLGLKNPDAAALSARWARSERHSGLEATFALAEDGPFALDLVGDGPHGLIAGTTGSGKSELLRSLVAALASGHGPERLNFVLIDYKGGSAFAECAELPHTVGLVTDLDEELGARALRSLEAELRYRERVLGEHRVGDLPAYQRLVREGAAAPLPRLVVIIDEFATLAVELPDFVTALVGVAQRGRSLGVHLLLATQRPSGAVNENIRANTNLRVCLRVQTAQDSTDVIDSPAAARIGRTQPGRAQVRLGPSELVPIQTALVTGASDPGESDAPVALRPFAFIADGDRAAGAPAAAGATPEGSDLRRLVAAARAAYDGAPAPRRPWLPPLPGQVALEELLALGPARALAGERGLVVALGLADDPDAQAQYPFGWNLDAGNLLLYGLGGSGTTTTLATIALVLHELAGPDHAHVYALDFGAGELAPLQDLPGVGAVILAAEHERQRRLIRRLRGELEQRRGLPAADRAGAPRIVVLLDGYAGFLSEHEDIAGDQVREALGRVFADGPEVGIHVAIAADRPGAIPTALASLAQQRLVFRLADLPDYAQFGIQRGQIPRPAPGRAVAGGSARAVQIARPRESLAAAARARQIDDARGGPPPIGVLPQTVSAQALLSVGSDGWARRDPLFIPLGIGDEHLEPTGFELYEGEHAIVSGPARSGRTSVLALAAEVARHLHPDILLAAVALRRSALRERDGLAALVTNPADLPPLVERLRAQTGSWLLLIDDADAVPDDGRLLTELFAAPAAPGWHAIVAGRGDALRALGHWSAGVRRSRTGLLLNPDVQMDGGLLGVTLPRRPAPPQRPGCGYLVQAGGFELIQTAL